MTFPNPDLGLFEGDNDKWCKHAAAEFTRTVTTPHLSAPDRHDGHVAVAHFLGFVMCAMADAGDRGSGEQIMEDVLKQVRPMWDGLVNGAIGVTVSANKGPHLTSLSGGKKDGE